jgi:hypothetical protein
MFDDRAVELKELRDVLDALLALDVAGLDDETVTATLVEGRRQRDRLDAFLAGVASVYDQRRIWEASGARSAAAHLASLRNEPLEACRADLRLARALRSMPLTAAALAGGRISRAHARRLAHAAGGSRGDRFADAEELLVDAAGTVDGHDFDRVIAYWIQCADDAAAEAEARAHDRDRWCDIPKLPDGRRLLPSMMTRCAGHEFAEVHESITGELYAADWARAEERLGRSPAASELERTPSQRRHDALVVMARRAQAAAPGARLPRPAFTLHVGGPLVFERLCELADGTVVTPGEAARHLTVADLERVLYETPDRVRVSTRTRLFRGAERRAVEARDRYCTFPGCRIPAHRCDVDHIVPDAEGGETTQANGRLRCPKHHQGRRRDQPWLHRPPDPDDPEEDDTS